MIDSRIMSALTKMFPTKIFKIYAMYDIGVAYLVGIKDKNSNEEPLDPWFTINKRTYKIKGFAPHDNIKLFNSAIRGRNLVSK